MKRVKLDCIEKIEYWKAFPSQSRRSKPQLLESKSVLQQISKALLSDLESVDLCFEDPEAPRFSVILYRNKLRPLYLKVFSDSILYNDNCYIPLEGRLWTVLQKSLKHSYESVHCPD